MIPIISSFILALALYATIVLLGQIVRSILLTILNRKPGNTDATANSIAVAVLWGLFYWLNVLV